LNISNDSIFRTTEGNLKINAQGRFMNKADVKLDYTARLYKEDHGFHLRGNMDAIDISDMNVFFERNESVRLMGRVRSLDFEFIADTLEAKGTLIFLYDSLSIEVTGKNGFIRDKLATWIGNYKLYDSNPLPGKDIRTGRINHKRDPERFLFNYSIKALMTGIKSTVTK
jgi:hypothetical protein